MAQERGQPRRGSLEGRILAPPAVVCKRLQLRRHCRRDMVTRRKFSVWGTSPATMSLWQIAQPASIQACHVLSRIPSLPERRFQPPGLKDLHSQPDRGSDAAA
jgi:hypothetical protein